MATIKDAVFKKKGDVPSSVLKALLVSNGEAAITEKLAQFKSPTASTPYVTPVITVANSTGRITDSRLVMRGSLFTAYGQPRPTRSQPTRYSRRLGRMSGSPSSLMALPSTSPAMKAPTSQTG